MSLRKQFLKSRPVCKVTFRVSKADAKDAKNIYLVGDFNDWNPVANPMKSLKSGEFTTVLELDVTKPSYQFRYLYNESAWENDSDADGYVPNGLGEDNSLISLHQGEA